MVFLRLRSQSHAAAAERSSEEGPKKVSENRRLERTDKRSSAGGERRFHMSGPLGGMQSSSSRRREELYSQDKKVVMSRIIFLSLINLPNVPKFVGRETVTKEVDDLVVATLPVPLRPCAESRAIATCATSQRAAESESGLGGRAIKLQTKVIVTAATAQGWAKQGCRLREFCSLCCLPHLPRLV